MTVCACMHAQPLSWAHSFAYGHVTPAQLSDWLEPENGNANFICICPPHLHMVMWPQCNTLIGWSSSTAIWGIALTSFQTSRPAPLSHTLSPCAWQINCTSPYNDLSIVEKKSSKQFKGQEKNWYRKFFWIRGTSHYESVLPFKIFRYILKLSFQLYNNIYNKIGPMFLSNIFRTCLS